MVARVYTKWQHCRQLSHGNLIHLYFKLIAK